MSGQHGKPLISNFSKSEYQAGTQNWSIHGAKDGRVFFGNNKGLLQFDGFEWSLSRLPNQTIVRAVSADSSGSVLYVGGQNELGYFDFRSSGETNFTSLHYLIPEEYRDYEDVWKVFQMNDGVFFCTEKAVFYYLGDSIEVIAPRTGRFENFFMLRGELVLQELGVGVYSISGSKYSVSGDEMTFAENRLIALFELGELAMAVTESSGIFLLTNGNFTSFDSEIFSYIKDNQAYTAIPLWGEEFLIGTTNAGVIISDSKGNIVRRFDESTGLMNNTVLTAFQDIKGNIWLGLDNGLSYVEINSPFSILSKEYGLMGTGYTAHLHKDQYYFGTNQGLFSSTGSESFELVSSMTGQIWSVQALDKGFVVNGHDGGFYSDDGIEYDPISETKGSWKLLDLGDSPYVLQGAYSGFYLYRKTGIDSDPLEFIGKMAGFEESCRVFEEDANGHIWMSHAYRGLYRLVPDFENLKFKEVKRFGSEEGLLDELYIDVSKVREELVFSTPHGIYIYDQAQGKFEEEREFSELLGKGKNVLKLLEDEKGNVWFRTDEEFGVIKIAKNGLYNSVELVRFNELRHELVDGFEQVFALNDGNIYIPTESGFYRFDDSIQGNIDDEFPLFVRAMVRFGNEDSLISVTGTAELDQILLGPESNNLKFHFLNPTYGKLNEIEYRCRLIPFEEEWTDWRDFPYEEYSNLDADSYVFEVQARNSFGNVSDTLQFEFVIKPKWFASPAGRLVMGFLTFLAILGMIRVAISREAKKTEEVKQKSQAELEKKEKEFKKEQEKSEDEIIRLRNEKLEAEVSHKNAELASTTMHLVQKSEILQTIKSELEEILNGDSTRMSEKVRKIDRMIAEDFRLDRNWDRFEMHFDQVHENFFKNLRSAFPKLTPKDQKLCAYLRMNLSSKEIAPLLNISVRGVEISRYRLRKKLGIDGETNLVKFIMEI